MLIPADGRLSTLCAPRNSGLDFLVRTVHAYARQTAAE